MSRFLNKKEEVIELKLTSHGKFLLGNGTFKPVYYAFLDDNVIYDASYAGIDETQSAAKKRIKEDTQYLESLVLFQDLEDYDLDDEISEMEFRPGDVAPRNEIQASEFYRFDQIIGDAYLLGDTRVAPSWKVLAFQSAISSSHFMDTENNTRIPQINISASYILKSIEAEYYQENIFNSEDPIDFALATPRLADDKIVYLERNTPVLYVEEANTQILNENFDIEVFEVVESESSQNKNITFKYLKRKYFTKKEPQIVDGIMLSAKKPDTTIAVSELSSQTVEHYFNILRDKEINRDIACKAAASFDKDSYYIDLDFDCGDVENNDINVDIYGQSGASAAGDIYGDNAEVPEICQN